MASLFLNAFRSFLCERFPETFVQTVYFAFETQRDLLKQVFEGAEYLRESALISAALAKSGIEPLRSEQICLDHALWGDYELLFVQELIKILDLDNNAKIPDLTKSGAISIALQRFRHWNTKLYVKKEEDDIDSFEINLRLLSEYIDVDEVAERLEQYNENPEDIDIAFDGKDLQFTQVMC